MVDTLKPAPKKKRAAQPSAEPPAPLPNTDTTECVMPTKKKSAKPAAKSRSETADDATFWREVALRSHAEGKREWFRSQLLAWLATLMGEFETVQAELQNDSSDLRKALTHDECSNIYSAIEDCWNALASSAAKPQCVPAFLTAEPVHFPKFATKGGAK